MVTGDPKPGVVWRHNGKSVEADSHYTITEEIDQKTYTMQLKNVALTEAGSVEVVATNQLGQATCDTTLDVEGLNEISYLSAVRLLLQLTSITN